MEICSSFSSTRVKEQIFKDCFRSTAIQAGKISKVGVEFVQLTIFLHRVAYQFKCEKDFNVYSHLFLSFEVEPWKDKTYRR
jgi:hypothetical protein